MNHDLRPCSFCSDEPCRLGCSPSCANPVHQTPATTEDVEFGPLCETCARETAIGRAAERAYASSADRALGYS